MKKFMTAILALCMCLSLFACSGAQKEMKTDIVGEWIAVNGNATVTFYEDGTGVLQYNGERDVTWKYDPDSDRYAVSAEQTYDAIVGKDYDMPYMSFMGMDFYSFDDYDKAYTLMLSRRHEDILDLTLEMTKIELDTAYDLADAVTVQFTEIAAVENDGNDGLRISYAVMNQRTETATDGLTAVMNSKYYLAHSSDAVTKTEEVTFAASVGADEMATGYLDFSFETDVQKTVDLYGKVIGAVYFNMFGQQYFVELGEYFK